MPKTDVALSILEKVIKGKDSGPRRCLVYGTAGIGKSTFAAGAEDPIFIQTEDGLGEIDCNRLPLAERFEDVTGALRALIDGKHTYKTVCLDSLDWLERLIWAEVCRDHGKKAIEDFGYGKGYGFAKSLFNEVLDLFTALRRKRAMTIVLIAHSKIETFNNPETESYDRYSPRLHRSAIGLIQDYCDEVFFASYKIRTKQLEEKFNQKRTQAIGRGERILKTQERPAYLAKNRLNLPEELPLTWAAYSEHFKPLNNGGNW